MTVNKRIEKMIDEVLKKEGGYVNHRSDRGGPTNFGITQKTLSNWYGKEATVFDVVNLKIETSKAIYRQNYYYIPLINELPLEIQPVIFDSAINHGPKRAIKFIQLVINKAGFDQTSVDGIIGPQTRLSSFKAISEMQNYLINAIVDERINFYKRIVINDKTQKVFLKGWLRRAESFRMEV